MKNRIVWLTLFFMMAGSLWIPPGARAITVIEEEKMGREFFKAVSAHYHIIKDQFISEYIETVGKGILDVMPPQPFHYKFYVVRHPVYNAFAGPAGQIFIHSGLFEALDNESELAAIVTHEIAHVTCRHISRRIERSSRIGLMTLAGVAAGLLLGVAGVGAGASAVTIGSMAAGQSTTLAYSREDERQADGIGLQYLLDAGYYGRSMLNVLNTLRERQWYGPSEVPSYLSTHPASEERLANIDAWLEKHAGDTETRPESLIDNSNFEKAHARIMGIYGNADVALRVYQDKVRRHPESPMAHYGYGLALDRAEKRKQAIGHLRKALAKRVFDADILSDIGRVYFFAGRYNEASDTLEGALGIDPQAQNALYYLGRTYLETGRPEAAAEAFNKRIAMDSSFNPVYYYLGESFSKLNRNDYSHYYLGIYYKNTGELKTADFHLKRALDLMKERDKIEKAKEMLKEIRGKIVAEKRKNPE